MRADTVNTAVSSVSIAKSVRSNQPFNITKMKVDECHMRAKRNARV